MSEKKQDTSVVEEIRTMQEVRDEWKLTRIRELPIDQISDFPDHPYKQKKAALSSAAKVYREETPRKGNQRESAEHLHYMVRRSKFQSFSIRFVFNFRYNEKPCCEHAPSRPCCRASGPRLWIVFDQEVGNGLRRLKPTGFAR